MSNNLRVTAQALKARFLNTAWPIVDAYINAALGIEELKSLNSGCREEVWDLVKKLMLQSSDKLEIDIKNAEDIIKAVSNGKCTFEEGDKLLAMFKKVKEIENINMQREGGGGEGLVINVLAPPQEADIKCISEEIINEEKN